MQGYDRASKWYNEKQRGTVLGSEMASLASCTMTYNPPRPIALSHRIMYIPCKAAIWRRGCSVIRGAPCGLTVFYLFPITKLHLASHPLARSYSRLTVSSKKCCLIFCFPPIVDWTT